MHSIAQDHNSENDANSKIHLLTWCHLKKKRKEIIADLAPPLCPQTFGHSVKRAPPQVFHSPAEIWTVCARCSHQSLSKQWWQIQIRWLQTYK